MNRFAATLLLVASPLLIHCGGAAAPSVPPAAAPSAPAPAEPPSAVSAPPSDIAELAGDAQRFVGHVVTLEGVFQAFEVSACRFGPSVRGGALSRRDWLFRTGAECVFVTGGRPAEFENFDPSLVGRALELKAQVEKDERGLLLLRYLDSRWMTGRAR